MQLGDGDNRDGTDQEEEEEEEEDLDELHDLSDEGTDGGTGESVHSKAEEQAHEEREDGQAKPDTEHYSAPPTDLGEEDRTGGGKEGAGRAQQTRRMGKGSTVSVDGGGTVAVGAPAGDDAEIEPEKRSSSEHHEMEISAATPCETNKGRGEQPLSGDQEEQNSTLENKETAAAALVPTGVNDAAETVSETVSEEGESGEGACDDIPLNGGSGASAEEDGPGDGDGAAIGGTGTDDVEAVHNTKVVPDGNPHESVEAIPDKPGDGTTGSLPPPPPLGGGNDAADARATSKGAAAAMLCQWLPVKLPPPPPSATGGGGGAHETIEPPSPVLHVGGAGVDLPPVVDGEALKSPQDAALLKRKADCDPSGK